MDGMNETNKDRINAIAARLVQFKAVTVNQLADEYGLSKETIRRDLNELELRGIAVRNHGGAILAQEIGGQVYFKNRADTNYLAKSKIGKLAAKLIDSGKALEVLEKFIAVSNQPEA